MFRDINHLRRVLVGFDRVFNESVSTSNYPPYNLVKVDDDNYFIELAVAGFARAELEIEINKDRLHIRGKKEGDSPEYVHHGIANRDFDQSFVLAEHVVVKNASLENGILTVVLTRIVPEELKPRTVDIQ